MLRKQTVVASFLVVGALAWQAHPAAHPEGELTNKTAPYVHSVIFYLKKDAPKDAAAELIADCHGLLAKIPSVKGVWAGRPADKDSVTFVVKDYTVGLLVMVENHDGLKGYIDHPLHLKFVEKHGKNLEKVQVYDYLNQAK